MQILLHAPAISPRLLYICQFIFKEIMLLDFLITDDSEVFKNQGGIKIKYTNDTIDNDHFTIGNFGLLFETDTREQDTSCFEVNGHKAFFKAAQADFPFDILSASFYLLSRYEEYLPHNKDGYGRYAHENSIAFREHFLHLPLINIWIRQFIDSLQKKFPCVNIPLLPFSFLPTYDIDMAYSYRHKGWMRNLGGFIKSPSINRVKVLFGLEEDPFDSYDWLDALHRQQNLKPLYFFLMAKENGIYDKNILPHKKAMCTLIKQHAQKYTIGIHPSWQSGDEFTILQLEKDRLQKIGGTSIKKSRQHYIRFNLPSGYRRLTEIGITDDYSMGYGGINGFRASVAYSFYWFDLQKNEATTLRIHPFCFMEANSFYEQKYTAEEAYQELMQYYAICKETGGQLITIWHNNFLGTDPLFAAWREIYRQFILLVKISG